MVNPLPNPTGNVALRWVYQDMLVKMTDKTLHGICVTWRHKGIRGIFNVGMQPLTLLLLCVPLLVGRSLSPGRLLPSGRMPSNCHTRPCSQPSSPRSSHHDTRSYKQTTYTMYMCQPRIVCQCCRHYPADTSRNQGVFITPKRCKYVKMASFWRYIDVITTSCVRWVEAPQVVVWQHATTPVTTKLSS